MHITSLHSLPEFIAGDNSILREVLHPDKAELSLRYSLAHATVRPGEESLPHRLSVSEVYYILEGSGVMYIGDESSEVGPHQTIYIPPKAIQHIANTGTVDLRFLCIVDPAWRKEYEEVS
jgi:mannose-6-phosphate isomerase-like protein (cupin superfamily)